MQMGQTTVGALVQGARALLMLQKRRGVTGITRGVLLRKMAAATALLKGMMGLQVKTGTMIRQEVASK